MLATWRKTFSSPKLSTMPANAIDYAVSLHGKGLGPSPCAMLSCGSLGQHEGAWPRMNTVAFLPDISLLWIY